MELLSYEKSQPPSPARASFFKKTYFFLVFWDRFLLREFDGPTPRFACSNFDWLFQNDWWDIVPSQETYNHLCFFCCMFALFVVFRILEDLSSICVSIIYTYLFLSTAFENNKHHYLTFYILWIMECTVQSPRLRMRLITLQMSIMYFWSFMTKMNYSTVFGTLMTYQVMTKNVFTVVTMISDYTYIPDDFLYRLTVITAILIEGFLCYGWLVSDRNKKLNFYTSYVGILFHVMILASGLNVGFFGCYVICCYVIIFP